MKKKLLIGFITYLLLFAFCIAVPVSSVQAQKKDRDKNSKPNDKAKKLLSEGNRLFARKDYRSAVNKYAEAIIASPNYAEAHYWKGYAHYYLNEFNEAADDLDAALDQGYSADEIYKVRWVVNFQREKFDESLSDVQKGLEKDKKNTDYINALGEIYVRKGQYDKAIPALQEALKTSPNNGDLLYFLAVSYANTGDSGEEITTAQSAVKNNTKFMSQSYVLLGDSLAEQNPTEAIVYYQKAMNVNTDLPETYYVRVAQLYRTQNRLTDAIELARKGLKAYPKSNELLIALTWYYSLADRNGEAVVAGEQAIRNAPDNSGAFTNLCRAYNDMKNYSQAIKTCNDALKITPNDGETLFYLGYAHSYINKPALAADYYKKAVASLTEFTKANPKNADGFYLLGNAYISANQAKNAIEAYKQSLALSPSFVKAHYNLGNVYVADKNPTAAREQFDALTKLDKGYAEKLKKTIDGSAN